MTAHLDRARSFYSIAHLGIFFSILVHSSSGSSLRTLHMYFPICIFLMLLSSWTNDGRRGKEAKTGIMNVAKPLNFTTK